MESRVSSFRVPVPDAYPQTPQRLFTSKLSSRPRFQRHSRPCRFITVNRGVQRKIQAKRHVSESLTNNPFVFIGISYVSRHKSLIPLIQGGGGICHFRPNCQLPRPSLTPPDPIDLTPLFSWTVLTSPPGGTPSRRTEITGNQVVTKRATCSSKPACAFRSPRAALPARLPGP